MLEPPAHSEGNNQCPVNVAWFAGDGVNDFPPAIVGAVGDDSACDGGASSLHTVTGTQGREDGRSRAGAGVHMAAIGIDAANGIGCPVKGIDWHVADFRIACLGWIGHFLAGGTGRADVHQIGSGFDRDDRWAIAIGGQIDALRLVANYNRAARIAYAFA